ncbi:MAG: preprotein translocase subunit SecG [Lachnospiraceae bacterium]|nr:preprotein translocase subunit SecG [Lachnospiraceae bacterium]
MDVLEMILGVVLVILGLVITLLVMMQEGKSAGFTGSISGMADSYWGKNKGRSIEGALQKATTWLVVVFFVICMLLNSRLFHTSAATTGDGESNVEVTTEADTEAATEAAAE